MWDQTLVSVIGFVCQAAIGDPLVAYADRVRAAMNRIFASRSWAEPQKRWLGRIAKQTETEIDTPAFFAKHRAEIARFGAAVANAQVLCRAVSYREWLATWPPAPSPVGQHAAALLDRFRP